MPRHLLGRIHRSVLPTRASKADHQIAESSVDIALYGSIHQRISRVKEGENLAIVFEELDDRLIESGKETVALILTGVVNRATVEYEAAAIARFIVGDTFFIRK